MYVMYLLPANCDSFDAGKDVLVQVCCTVSSREAEKSLAAGVLILHMKHCGS
jgi:hypothetical protein